MNKLFLLAILACAVLAPALFATTVSSDITSDATWNNAGSPYTLTTDIIVYDATLTIDTSGGDVEVVFGTMALGEFDLQIGNGAGNVGVLNIDASSGVVRFKLRKNSNFIVNAYGQVLNTDSTAVTYFQNDSTGTLDKDWGAIDFAASLQYQSHLVNCNISGGGYDGKDGAIVVGNSSSNTPLLEDLTFDSCNTSAIRFDGNGINTLRQNGLKLPLSVSNTDYVFYLNAVTSTVPIRFPDPDLPDSPEAKLSGTCTVGDSSNVSHWRFDDAYTFDCAASSKVDVANGSVWGTEECRPTFQSISATPGFTDWSGLWDSSTTKTNVFGGGLGAFAFLTATDASYGVRVAKGSSGTLLNGMTYRIAGITALHCNCGIYAASPYEAGVSDGVILIEDAHVGGTTSATWCDVYGINIGGGAKSRVLGSNVLGLNTTGTNHGILFNGPGECIVEESRVSGASTSGINVFAGAADLNLAVIRSIIDSNSTYSMQVVANYIFSVGGTVDLEVEHCVFSGSIYAAYLEADTGSEIRASLEDCTFADGGDYGIYAKSIPSLNGSLAVTRCNFWGFTNGIYLASDAVNTVEPSVTECFFTENAYGIRDARTQTARAVVSHCTFIGNTTYGAFDDSGGGATTNMLAENCYWGMSDGPGGSGPGSGDNVNGNVDYDPFLARPYIGFLIGGNPAGASSWDVWESTSVDGDDLHIIDSTPYFKWTFASDFDGDTQSAYEIEVDNDLDFSSTLWDTAKTTSTDKEDEYAGTALIDGTIYYARVRMWNNAGLPGPWRYLTFRLNNAPAQVGNTSRTPASASTQTDWTPVLVWERPTDTNEDPLHFQVDVSATIGVTDYAFVVKSWAASTASGTTPTSLDVRSRFEISTDSGSTWTPMPPDGAPAGDAILVRLTWPDAWGLADTGMGEDWSWSVTAYDGFETGTASSTWTFDVGISYTFSGTLTTNGTTGENNKTISICRNGTLLGDTDNTDSSGNFAIVTTEPFEVGDAVVIYRDSGGTARAGRVFIFNGNSMSGLDLRHARVYVGPSLEGQPITNSDFAADSGVDTRIPWTESAGAVTFSSALEDSGDGVFVLGDWDVSGTLDGTTSLNVALTVAAGSHLRTQGYDLSFHSLDNDGWLQVEDGSTFTIDGAASTSSGRFELDAATLKFAGSSSLTLTVDAGTFHSRNGTTIEDLTANVSGLTVDTATAGAPAVLSCADTTFDEVSLTVEADGVLALFNDNIFQNDVSTQHIHWKSESDLSATQMRGVQFNTSVNGTSTFNVTATSTANNINMLGCGGVGQGEAFDSDSNNKVDWELTPPTGLRLTLGDTRIRADWDANDQVDASAFGFNLYKALVEDSTWTSAPSYEPISMTTDFVDTSANFTSALIGATFYPDASNTTSLTVLSVPSSTSIRVSGDHSGDASSGDTYSFFVKVNGSLLTDTHDEAESLTNGTAYYFYLTIDDSTEDAPLSRNRGEARTLAPAASSISAVSPDNSDSDSVLALSVIGENTHWESSTTVAVTKDFGIGLTVNDTLVISAKLILVDATLSTATTGTWTVTTLENDIWGIAAYDEVETADLTINANDADLADRPTLVFSTNNGGIAADADTSGSFIFNIDFTDQGGGVDTTKLEIYASRDVTISSANKTAGTELIGAGLSIDTLNDSRATCTINQTAGTELFADGEYTLTARVADDDGNYSEWATRRFYVEGAASDVAKTGELLHQGDTELTFVITGTFSTTVDDVDFGSGITTVSYNKDSGTEITVTVTVDETAACGPRTFTVDMTTGTDPVGVIIVEYPTNILPTVNNDEPSRNPAIGGVNVFLVNGEFFKSETDLAVRGRMMGISWSRFYRSQITYDGPLGHGWVGHYFQRAVIDSGSSDIWWYTPDGRKEVFPDVTGGYSSPVGVYVTASSESTHNTITLTDRHGYQCVFNADGRLWRCIDRNGNTTECSYNYAGQLTTITNDLGETFTIAYHTHGRVDTVSDNMWNDGTTGHTAARQVEYEFDSEGNLTEQKAPTTSRYDGSPYARTTYGYAYDSAHNLTRCINPREFAESSEPVAYLENFYDSSDRVIDQKLGDEADVLDSHITKSAFIRLRYESSTLIHEIDRNGHRTDYTIDGTGRATTVKRYTGFYSVDTDEPIVHSTVTSVLSKLRSGDPTSFDTVFTYNSNHEILTITSPRGNKVTREYPSGSSQTSGTCTSDPTDTVLADTGKSWTPDAYIGMILRVGSNAGEYAYYPIVDNDATTITIESDGYSLSGDGWLSGEDYAVYDESSDPMGAGNVLSVTRSDEGLGSESDIVTSYTYEPRYQFVKTVTDPRGNTSSYSYDYEESAGNGADAGNLVLVTSPTITGSMASSAAITTRTTYNEFGQPVTMVDGEGNVTYLKYYTSGSHNGFLYQRISAWGELDLTSEFDYDPVGNLTASWSPRAFESGATKDDYKTSYEVNELNQTWHVTSKYEVGSPVSSSLVSVDSYRYFDANGNLTQTFREYITDGGTSPSGPTDADDPTTFSKSSSAMAATWVESSYQYSLLNYQTSRTVDAIAGSAITQYTSRTEYDSNYNVLASISPLGNRSHTVFDERDMVYQRIAGAESDVAGTFQTDYDANGNVISSFDALGNETEYTYDGFDRATQVADAGGNYRTSAYDANSNVTTSSAYDVFGTLLAQSTTTYDQINRAHISARLAKDHNGNPIGDGWNTSTTLFDKNSRVVSSTNDNGVTYTSFYDGANRTTETRDAVGNRTLYTYNANGATTQVDYIEINGLNGASEPSHVSYILNRSDVAWEVRDRRWSTSFDTSGNTTRDSWGRVTVSTDAAGNTVSTNYDLLSRVTDSTEEAGTDDIHTMFEYDDDGRTLTRAIKRNPGDTTYQETEYVYDERSRLITLRRPDGDIWNFRYDVNGNRTGWDDPLGTTVTDTYDARNLISYRNIVRGTGIVGTDYESYEFDGLGRLQSCSNYADGELITASAWEYNTQSQPERHDQTICDYQGAHLGTWTTQAEYDATGFNTATIYSNGRRVDHLKDQLDRLSASYDEDNAIYIAAYVYGGPRRIVERTLGNGTRTSYTYEASGCGCGGATQFIERVEHTEISNGRTLWATQRRHDIRGLVTAESRDQEGANGNVFRYDEAERLTNTYYGVDLSSTGLDTYGDPANTPSTFGLKRAYTLDPRGNRINVIDYDDELSPTTIWDAGYSANADTNQYTAADASSFSYDAIEQLTTDNGRSLGFAYDYKGQLITEEADSDNPERRYSYDNQGRRRTEERFYEASYDLGERISFCYGPGINDTCAGSLGDQATEEHVDAGDGTLQHSIYYSFGAGAVGGVSGRAKHPATPAFPVGGHFHGPDRIFELVDPATGGDLFRYRYEDQLGSLIGMADENGAKLLDEVYLDYGRAVERIIAYDGDHDDVNEGSSGGSPPNTTIAITGASFTTDEFKGMQLCVADLNNAAFYAGTVQSNTGTAITVDDPSGYINTAVLTDDLDFVIYDFVDTAVATSGSYHTAGEWTSVSFEENDPGTLDDRTKFTDSGANFASYMVGWLISVNVEEFAYLEITDVDEGGTWVRVNGNASNLAAADDRYWVFAPPHVDPSTGAMKGSYTGGTFEPEYHTSYLWGLYRYQPPMVGYYVDPDGAPALGVYGAQSGTNMAGTYHAGAREYDPSIGRWTTPDPVALPWRNLFHYLRHRPLSKNDPSGLTTWRISESLDSLDNGGSPEDDLGDGAKSLGAETDVETNADESEILEHIKQTGEDDVFVYLGHTWDMDGDGTADTLEEHDGALTSGLIGLAGGGLIGGLAGLATCGNDAVDEDEFDEAADDAKGVIVLLGCKGCGLKDKFKNAKCVICSETDMDKMCASSLMRFMGETLEGLAKGESMTWEKMKDKMNEHLKEKKCTERMVAKGDKCSTTNISKSK